MSMILDCVAISALLLIVLLLSVSAHAEETRVPLTIADCPVGWALVTEEMTEREPLWKAPDNQAAVVSQNNSGDLGNPLSDPNVGLLRLMTTCVPPPEKR